MIVETRRHPTDLVRRPSIAALVLLTSSKRYGTVTPETRQLRKQHGLVGLDKNSATLFASLALLILLGSWLAAFHAFLAIAAALALTVLCYLLWKPYNAMSILFMAALLAASGAGATLIPNGGYSALRIVVAVLAFLFALFAASKTITRWGQQPWLSTWAAWCLCSAIWSSNPLQSAMAAGSLVGGMMLGSSLAIYRPGSLGANVVLKAGFFGLLASVALLALAPSMATVQTLRPGEGTVQRFVGIWPWNSSIGLVASVVVITALAFWLKDRNAKYLLAVTAGVVGLVVSASATAIVATGAGLLGMLWIYRARWRRLINILAVITIILWISGTGEAIVEAVLQLLGRSSDLTGRTVIWDIVVNLVAERPILGYGVGTAPDLEPYLGFQAHAHSGYLQVLLEVGFIGAAFFLLASISVIRAVFKSGNPALAGIVTVFFVSNAANNFIMVPGISFILFIWISFTIASKNGLAIQKKPSLRSPDLARRETHQIARSL